MNRRKKTAMERFVQMNDKDKVVILSMIMRSQEYEDFTKKHKSKLSTYNLPNNFLAYHLAQRFEANTVNGRCKASYYSDSKDSLELIEVMMPCGVFTPADNKSYQPLGVKVTCTNLVLPFVQNRYEREMFNEWNKIKHALRSSSLSEKNQFIEPRLNYEPKYTQDQDVYFVLDMSENIVKIGISNNIPRRIDSIRKQYDTGKLNVLTIVKGGGLEVEALLHSHFEHLRINKKGKGREWFKYNQEMILFVNELNSSPVKSKVIQSLCSN